jgi:hypothetical protein
VTGKRKKQSMPLHTKRESIDYTTYLQERASLVQGEMEGARSFDKYLITLSAGALALSITFVHEISPHPVNTRALIVAWSSFALCLIVMLISFLCSQKAFRDQRDTLDEWYSNPDIEERENVASEWTGWLNHVGFALFVIGMLALMYFTLTNLDRTSSHSQASIGSVGISRHRKETNVADHKQDKPQVLHDKKVNPNPTNTQGAKPPKLPQKPRSSGKPSAGS